MKIRDYLENKKLICDGAFGTYFTKLHGGGILPESCNCLSPQWMKEIHKEYMEAGAVLLRTNTFASNRSALNCDKETLRENITAAWKNACQAAEECGKRIGEDCFIAGDIGPIPMDGAMFSETVPFADTKEDARVKTPEELLYEEYRFICDTLTEAGADILIFETFTDMDAILPVIRDIKKEKELFIIVQFCVNQHGYSNAGISAGRLLKEAGAVPEIDAAGFNCGVGPGHLYSILKNLELPEGKIITALPNAGYPKYMEKRKVFGSSAEYFAGKMGDIAALGVDIIGGCCGTNPEYIKKVSQRVKDMPVVQRMAVPRQEEVQRTAGKDSSFWQGKEAGKKLIAVELSPSPGADDEKVMEAAYRLKNMDVDVVTFPDSPSGRTRTDSVLMSMKVQHETGLTVMPHICCRDRNAIAMRSQLLGAYVNGVRNLLVITGDPVPTLMRQDIKSVFNFDSVGLMKMIAALNEEEFAKDPMVFGGALNQGRRNLEVEIGRVKKKMEKGAQFFLTQPVFTKEDADRLALVKEQTGARILCGIMPLVSYRNALFIKNEMAGIHVSDEILAGFSPEMSREEGENAGAAIARKVIEYTKGFVDGYYFSIPFNRVYLLDKIL